MAVSGNGEVIAAGAKAARNRAGESTGAVYFYMRDGGNEFTSTVVYGNTDGSQFGHAIAMSEDGTRVVVGSPFDSNSAGGVSVYEYRRGSSPPVWDLMGEAIEGEGGRFGFSVAISREGDVIAVGAILGGAQNGGSVKVYEWIEDIGWLQQGSTLEGESSMDMTGFSVSLSSSGTVLAVGTERSSKNQRDASGHVTVYTFQDSSWNKVGDELPGETAQDLFGSSVALSGDGTRLVAGSEGYDLNKNTPNSGYCAIFDLVGGRWRMTNAVTGEDDDERMGHSAAISKDGSLVACGGVRGDIIIPTGVISDSEDTGVVRLLKTGQNRVLSTFWPRYTDGVTLVVGSRFGSSVALTSTGETLVVGAPEMTVSNQTRAGAIQVFATS